MTLKPPPLLEVEGLHVKLGPTPPRTTVLADCSLSINRAEVVGVVGESGSGKTMLGLTVMGLLPAGAEVSARRLSFDGLDLLTATPDQHRTLRGRRIAMIFQDPMTALNPYLRVYDQLAEMLPSSLSRIDRKNAVNSALQSVKLPDPQRCARAYPHELSGGMRQRALIAMMLLGEPELLIADEPTTALDPTVQADVLELLAEIVRKRGLAMMFVSHDLAVVAQVADRVAVMYAGETVEVGRCEDLLRSPAHPYTAALLASRPSAQRRGERLRTIEGQVPSAGVSPGCAFAPRCEYMAAECEQGQVPLKAVEDTRSVRCVRYGAVALSGAHDGSAPPLPGASA